VGRGIDRARDDLAAGELWRARDRLRGVLQNDPANQEALDLVGEVYWQMGDRPQAGRFWALTERSDERAAQARAAFEAALPNLRDRLRAVPARQPVDAYPAAAREWLAQLQAEATRAGIDWKPRTGLRRPRKPRDRSESVGWMGEVAGCLVVAVFLGIWLIGLAAIVGFAIWLVL
jgi:hypothetical protein